MGKKTSPVSGYLLALLLFPFFIIMIYPFLYMVSSTFKDQISILNEGFNLIPLHFSLNAYKTVFSQADFLRYFVNSTVIAVIVVGANMIFSPMAGYAFAKKDFPGKKISFILLLSTMMIPIHLTLIPLFRFFTQMKWVDTYYVLTIPFLVTPLGIFLMRQYIHGLPNELLQAAKIDGCSEMGIFWRIIYPLTGPVLAVLVINTFLSIWNSYIWPFIFTTRQQMWTLTVGVANYGTIKQQAFSETMVTATLAALPTSIVFLIFQKYIISGLTAGAIKG
jgi:multiple sugar transport system permease protein